MSLSTYFSESGRHVARLCRRRAYAPTSNTASHDNHKEFPHGPSVHDANCVSRFGSNFLPQFRSDDARLQILKLLVFLALDLLYYNFWWKMRQESRGKVIVKDLSTVSFQRLYY